MYVMCLRKRRITFTLQVRDLHGHCDPLRLARHASAKTLTGIEEPMTEEEKLQHERRMKKLAAREKETGIVVHVMSQVLTMFSFILLLSSLRCVALCCVVL